MSYETLIVERHGHVGWLIFNRPKALNAMNATMMGELEAAWRELDADPAVRVIVNAGEGAAFQTGVDVVQIDWGGRRNDRPHFSIDSDVDV